MYLEILQAREALVAGGTAMGFFISVSANVDEHFVPAAHTNEKALNLFLTC